MDEEEQSGIKVEYCFCFYYKCDAVCIKCYKQLAVLKIYLYKNNDLQMVFLILLFSTVITAGRSEKTKWLSPFNDFDRKSLCTVENRNWIMTRLTNKTRRTHKVVLLSFDS